MSDAAAELADYMGELSQAAFAASWMQDLEYQLWLALCDGPRPYGREYLTSEAVAELRRLSDAAGGWVVFDEVTDETFVAHEEWQGRFDAWRATHPSPSGPDGWTFLDSDPVAALGWTERALATGPRTASLPEGFDWHGFAFTAAAEARRWDGDVVRAEACARIATSLYERLAAVAGDPSIAASCELSAMTCRLGLVQRLGHVAGHPVRDLAHVVAWFHERCELPLARARAEADRIRALSVAAWHDEIETVRTLRRIKNRLKVFHSLAEPPTELAAWLELWPRLP